MSKTTLRTLYRPVGVKELQLILDSNSTWFPPRLEWQPIFYPVLNKEYAVQIARDWNTRDAASGYAGFVTEFDVDSIYIAKFDEHVVGAKDHCELWVPAQELETFNSHIHGPIRVVAAFYGDKHDINSDFQKHVNELIVNTQNITPDTNSP